MLNVFGAKTAAIETSVTYASKRGTNSNNQITLLLENFHVFRTGVVANGMRMLNKEFHVGILSVEKDAKSC